MATTNNAVTLTAGMLLTAQYPNVGAGVLSSYRAFTDGHYALDQFITVATSSTALNVSLGGDGFLLIQNGGTQIVSLLVGATAMGTIPAGTASAPFAVLIPVSSGVIINATVPSGTQQVGVSALRTVINV